MMRFGKLIGQNQRIKEVYALIEKAATVDVPVFIVGETGTGKELVAREIHNRSSRHHKPFVAMNIGAVPDTLIASTLFGHEKGSFTGAYESHIGCFQEAEDGTLFLDEATTMDHKAQISLLRVLETSYYRPVGSSKEYKTNARILSAANKEPSESIQNHEFRIDLLHRLQVIRINIPPLRSRQSDIPQLIQYFLLEVNKLYQQNIKEVSKEVMECLKHYSWPGNIRELRNVIYQSALMAKTEIITMADLPHHIKHSGDDHHDHFSSRNQSFTFPQPLINTNGNQHQDLLSGFLTRPSEGVFFPVGLSLEEVQKTYLNKTLMSCHNNKSMAAKLLGLSRKTIYCKLKNYGFKT